ncbi:hypothetical protein ACLBKT_12755 [Erythrobacter sp. W302b]|uniref:hypothetical protein n=1 Tax=Erythrobacter sp. W302b TaxID=3389874 RepID=UPI00396AF0FD
MTMSAKAVLLAGLMITANAQAEPPRMRVRPAETPTPAPSPGDSYGLPGAPNERALRARANLEALLQGRIYTSDLSPQDLQDVLDFERMARGIVPDNRTFQQQCIDEEVRRNGGNPTQLAWQVIRLKCQ